MKFPSACLIALGLLTCLPVVSVAEKIPAESELIGDNHFQQGFILWETPPGRHVKYGQLPGITNALPVWGLSQWSSRFPLSADAGIRLAGSGINWSNQAKSVTVGPPGSERADISLALNTGVEYSPNSRKAGEPWVHLLVEQELEPPVALEKLSAAKLHVEARLLRSKRLPMENYSPGVHAAQFQIYFTVQNRKHGSKGYGDLLWFGVPIYDDRHAFPQDFAEQDFGGTAKFIVMRGWKNFSDITTHDGKWVTVDKDLIPLMRAALNTAWSRGFLKDSQEFGDYYIGGVYMGWELPGSFDVAMQVRNLSLKAVTRTSKRNDGERDTLGKTAFANGTPGKIICCRPCPGGGINVG